MEIPFTHLEVAVDHVGMEERQPACKVMPNFQDLQIGAQRGTVQRGEEPMPG